MEKEVQAKKYVELKQERTFGDMIGIPFTFLFQEFKGMMLAILKYGGSIFALAILLGVVLLRNAFTEFPLQGPMFSQNETAASFFLVWFVFMIGIQVVVATAYHYMSAYEIHGKGNFTINDVGKGLFMTVLKIFGASLVLGLLSLPLFLFVAIPFIGGFVLFALLAFISVNLSLFPFIIAHEKAGIGSAFLKSFKLLKGKFWFSLGLYVVFVIIVYFTLYASIIPMVVVGVATPLIGATSQIGTIVMIAMFAVIIFFIYIMLITTMNILFGLQYFNLLVRKEGNNLTNRISAINDNEKEEPDEEASVPNEQAKNGDSFPPKKEEQTKTDDEPTIISDENRQANRFETDEDENNRFKPKY